MPSRRDGLDARRRFLVRSALLGLGAACLPTSADAWTTLLAQSACPDTDDPGELLATLPLFGSPPHNTPYGQIVGGAGLDARRFTDLSLVRADRLLTPTPELFLRTTRPGRAEEVLRSGVTVRHSQGSHLLAIDNLIQRSRSMGPHLIECSGNNDPNNFGLMSVAEWDGVPLIDIVGDIERAGLKTGPYLPDLHGNTSVRGGPAPGAATRTLARWGGSSDRPGAPTALLVSGVDHEQQTSRRSIAGASWIFPLTSLDRTGAFLATRVNGAPLPPDHGAPVRLVVPGWYGCAWIKWVNEVRLVGDDEPATPHMREFAARTHQDGVPERARDFHAPEIDVAATPIRVEKRHVNGKLEYRIVGIVWGGHRPVERLTIRFSAAGSATPFAICPVPATHRTWSLWEYSWRPAEAGVYDIVLKVDDAAVRTRRLDVSYYIRRVRIDEV